MSYTFAPRVRCYSGEQYVLSVHPELAQRLVSDGYASRRNKGRRVFEISLTAVPDGKPALRLPNSVRSLAYRQSIREDGTTVARCWTFRPMLEEEWPIFRSALIDCLPRSRQKAIHDIFSGPRRPVDLPRAA